MQSAPRSAFSPSSICRRYPADVRFIEPKITRVAFSHSNTVTLECSSAPSTLQLSKSHSSDVRCTGALRSARTVTLVFWRSSWSSTLATRSSTEPVSSLTLETARNLAKQFCSKKSGSNPGRSRLIVRHVA
jgi:hypothetical protein